MAVVRYPNETFINLLSNTDQVILLDANIIIPPDRTNVFNHDRCRVSLEQYSNDFLNHILDIFPNAAIHESVYNEICVTSELKKYVDNKINSNMLRVLYDNMLNQNEKSMMDTVEGAISPFTKYDPIKDNSSDKGEVKSISYAVAKGYLYFSTNDIEVVGLFQNDALDTYLNNIGAITLYELIYYVYRVKGSSKLLKGIYKLLYYLTDKEKKQNPNWSEFTAILDGAYQHH